jgi:hypothetical protein
MTKFNLSSKIIGVGKTKVIYKKDVQEFIRLLKEYCKEHNFAGGILTIDELAGKDLK